MYTAVSRKVVGKSARDNPERYCGWFCLPCSPKKFERIAREATDICSRVLMESNKSRFDSYSRWEQCIDHIPHYLSGLSRAHFSDNLFRNSCINLIVKTLAFKLLAFSRRSVPCVAGLQRGRKRGFWAREERERRARKEGGKSPSSRAACVPPAPKREVSRGKYFEAGVRRKGRRTCSLTFHSPSLQLFSFHFALHFAPLSTNRLSSLASR